MSKVFVSVTMSLDGCIAPEHMQLGQPTEKWLPQWMELQHFLFQQEHLRKILKLKEGRGETGADNRFLEETFARTGANIMGKRMFDGGEQAWPEEAPFHCPVFVLTHQVREPWPRLGGTTFYFVNDGIESALRQAKEAAGRRDVRISGGANAIIQYLNAGLVDELHLAISPMLMGPEGLRLFADVDEAKVALKPTETFPSPHVTHVRYEVSRK